MTALLDQLEREADKFLKTERLTNDKLQKLDGLLHDLVQREIVKYQRDGAPSVSASHKTASHLGSTRRSILGEVGSQVAKSHATTSLRSKTPLGLSNLSSVPTSKRSPSSVTRSGLSAGNVRVTLKQDNEWNRIVAYNAKKFKEEQK